MNLRRTLRRTWTPLAIALAASCTPDADRSDGSGADVDPPGGTDTGPDAIACEDRPLTLAAATGVAGAVPLADGDTVTMTYGPQGGWHLWSAGLVGGPVSETVDDDPATPRRPVQIAVTVVAVLTGQQLSGAAAVGTIDIGQPGAGSYDPAACAGQFYGFLGKILDASSGVTPPTGRTYQDMICGLEGQELELTIALTDLGTGAVATDTVTVIAALDPIDVPYCH
jgi:hypothetical protein